MGMGLGEVRGGPGTCCGAARRGRPVSTADPRFPAGAQVPPNGGSVPQARVRRFGGEAKRRQAARDGYPC